MSGVLDDAWAKWNRAVVHADEINRQIGAWVNSETDPPYKVEFEQDTAAKCLIARVAQVPALPSGWSVIIGDMIHNFHASLDYLAWRLFQAGTDRDPEKARRVYWPIVEDAMKTTGIINQCLPGLRDEHRTVVEKHQPYRGKPGLLHPLKVLADLSRKDKHRQLVVLLARHVKYMVAIAPRSVVREIVVPPRDAAIMKVGAELARVFFVPSYNPETAVKVQIPSAVTVAFEDGIYVMEAINHIGNRIHQILTEFGPLL